MRGILVGWLIEVHLKFKLLPETLFLTINLIDRYTEKGSLIARTQYQLVGVTAMLIASKYEEIYAPEIKDFAFITDDAYTRIDILAMEQTMLRTLDFNLTAPSPYRFLERYAKLSESDDLIFYYARYVIELTLLDVKLYKWSPSLIAASAIYLAKKVMKRNAPWNEFMAVQTNYAEFQVRDCARELCYLLTNACNKQEPFCSLNSKFSLPKFMEVAKIVPHTQGMGPTNPVNKQGAQSKEEVVRLDKY